MNEPLSQIALWEFPESDFAEWRTLTGEAQIAEYRDYVSLLNSVREEHEQRGLKVVFVAMSVSEMVTELKSQGYDNTPACRATIIAIRANNQSTI